ncbi:MAG: hypothetical protein ACLFQV_00655 [Vulcanimicrobiota bacterium]
MKKDEKIVYDMSSDVQKSFGNEYEESLFESGNAKADLEQVKGFNLGGLLLSGIWALGNRLYIMGSAIMLMSMIHWVFFIIGGIVMGLMGNEFVWKKKKYASVQDFKDDQKRWAVGGIAFAVIVVIIALVVNLFIKPVVGPNNELQELMK